MLIDIGIKVERKIRGIEMGVLENGVPYLTQRGLSAIAGAARSTIFEITREWEREFENPIFESGTRIGFLKEKRDSVLTWFCLGLPLAHILTHDEKGLADRAIDILNFWVEWIYWGVTVFWNWIWVRGGWIWVWALRYGSR